MCLVAPGVEYFLASSTNKAPTFLRLFLVHAEFAKAPQQQKFLKFSTKSVSMNPSFLRRF
jgi:hypothetical protein